MKNILKTTILAFILFSALPARAISYRSIVTFNNNAEKCEKKFISNNADFTTMTKWWDKVYVVTNYYRNEDDYLNAFIEMSKVYCKALQYQRESLDAGVDRYIVETNMAETVYELNMYRIQNNVYR